MKAAQNPDLAALITRLERRRKIRATATTLMASLGLVGFGLMMVPVLSSTHAAPPVASVEAPTTTPAPNAYDGVRLIGKSAIVYDLTTGQPLYEKNAERQLPLASLTKLLTTYAAVNALGPNAPVIITPTAVAQDGDSGLVAGETFAFRDLMRFTLVASSNDGAEAIAEAAAQKKDVSNTALLAGAAAAAGLTDTYANNGTGLDISPTVSGGYGTAEDVAKLAGAVLKSAPDIAEATIEPSVTISDYRGTLHTLPNTNQDIVRMPGPLLSKTGYTDLAGGNLAVVFDAGINHPVAVVVLGSTENGRFTDVAALVSRTLDHFAQVAP